MNRKNKEILSRKTAQSTQKKVRSSENKMLLSIAEAADRMNISRNEFFNEYVIKRGMGIYTRGKRTLIPVSELVREIKENTKYYSAPEEQNFASTLDTMIFELSRKKAV